MRYFLPLLFLSACATTPISVPDNQPVIETKPPISAEAPGGYYQFCHDNPTSLLCPE